MAKDWEPAHDAKSAELCDKYAVTVLIEDVEFEILPVEADLRSPI
jgi:hypothetical protein